MLLVRNQKGISLVEILLVVALTGGMVLVTMKLIQSQHSNEALIKANAEISKVMGQLNTYLSNPDNCRSMVGGYERSATATDLVALRIRTNRGDVEVLREGKTYGNFTLKALPVNSIQLLPNSTINSDTVADLKITFHTKNLNMLGDEKIVERKISFLVNLDPTNKIISCGPVISDTNVDARKKFCESLADGNIAVWDEAAKTCRLNDMGCPPGQIPHQMDRLGVKDCKPFDSVVPVEQIFNVDDPGCHIGPAGIKIGTDGAGRVKIICL